MKVIESAGKTREEAIQNGLKELGVDMHDLEKIDVVDEGSKGFLGLGARPVRVRLTVERSDDSRPRRGGGRRDRQERRDGGQQERRDSGRQERPEQRGGKPREKQEQQRGSRQEGGPKEGKPGGDNRQRDSRTTQPEKQEGQRRKKKKRRSGGGASDNRQGGQNQPQQRNMHKPSPIVGASQTGNKHKAAADEAAEAIRRAESFENGDDDSAMTGNELPPDARPDDVIETITDEQGKEAAAMLSEVLALMELNGKADFSRVADGSARLTIESEDDGGILIGKRGVTLHAIQYLINRMIAQNETADNAERVVVDVGGYVDRRESTLADMAKSMAKRAKETGRNVRLKPLSPQERRIIHLTLEPDPAVRTYSMGDSLFRSIVINPVGGRGGGANRRDRGNHERNRNAGNEPTDE